MDAHDWAARLRKTQVCAASKASRRQGTTADRFDSIGLLVFQKWYERSTMKIGIF
jgi:hypothetical protein